MPVSNSSPVKKMLELFFNHYTLSAISKCMSVTDWKNDLAYFYMIYQNRSHVKELLEGTERIVCYVSLKGFFFFFLVIKMKKD